ncbi:hypothetical protein JW949_01930 [Candidatus Woesearchaeota archaeon]|nr:hypothetical protein [Candidatus Woesearchaeota archaeon]
MVSGLPSPKKYHQLLKILDELEENTGNSRTGSLDDRVNLLMEFQHPDKNYGAKLEGAVRGLFLEAEDDNTTVYAPAYKLVDKHIKDKKLGGSEEDSNKRWEIVDAFIEQAIRHIYHISDDKSWDEFKNNVIQSKLPESERKNKKEFKKQLRALYDEAVGEGQLGKQIQQLRGVTSQELYSDLEDKTNAEAKNLIYQRAQAAAQSHTIMIQNLLYPTLIGEYETELRDRVYTEMDKKGFIYEKEWDKMATPDMVRSLLLNKHGSEKMKTTYKEIGYKEKPKDTT